MVLSRAVEDRLHHLFGQGRLRGRLISGRGQEAIPVGVTAATDARDIVCPVHRDLGAHLARGTSVEAILLHYAGRQGSVSNGRDGDIHMGVWDDGVFPMISHLPDSWPVALGLGLDRKWRGDGGVVVAFCGDGATSTGAWHEAMNAAAVWRTPNVFVVEDNQYAYSTPTAHQHAGRLVDRAAAYGMAGTMVDGNDVEAVFGVARTAIDRARAGGGATLIVAETMRIDGHAVHDPAHYVPPSLLEHWRTRDPIARQQGRLVEAGVLDASAVDRLRQDAATQVSAAVATAFTAPEVDPATLLDGVFADPPPPAATTAAHDAARWDR